MPNRDVFAAAADTAALFASAFAANRDGLLVLRAVDGVILEANDALLELVARRRAEIIGTPVDDLGLWVDARERWRVFFASAAASASDVADDLRLLDARGHAHDVAVRGRAVGGCSELAVLVQLRDDTETRARAHALREVEHKLAVVFDAAPDGIAIVRRHDGVILDVNDSLCAMSEYAREALIGRRVTEIRPFADENAARAAVRQLDRFGGYRNLRVDLVTPSGRVIPTRASATAVELDGEPCILNLLRDVSEQKNAEDALRRADLRFRSAFADAPLGIALVDGELKVTEANRCLADLAGSAPAALRGVALGTLVAEQSRPLLAHLLRRLLSDGGTPVHLDVELAPRGSEPRFATLHAIAQADAAPFLIVQLLDVTEVRKSRAQMERLAFYDPLTQLANRRLYMDRLEQAVQHARRAGRPAALLYVDLDRFKEVNDAYGHEAGDALLRDVAHRLQGAVRGEDTVARLGGDEFAILLLEVRDRAAARQVADHLLEVLQLPFALGAHAVTVSASIGVALTPDDGTDPSTLARHADRAMYLAKQSGRGGVRSHGLDDEAADLPSVPPARSDQPVNRATNSPSA